MEVAGYSVYWGKCTCCADTENERCERRARSYAPRGGRVREEGGGGRLGGVAGEGVRPFVEGALFW